jgi:hypothetical protein
MYTDLLELIGIMDRYKHDLGEYSSTKWAFSATDHSVSCGTNYNRVRMSICSGFFRNAAKKGKLENCSKVSVLIGQIPRKDTRLWSKAHQSASTRRVLFSSVHLSGVSTMS